MTSENNWYIISNINEVDSPALVIYKDRVKENIRIVKSLVSNINNLRPHVKTHKSAGITKLFIEGGINKFKCATIAEAEMLAMAGAKDVLLAYQPVGPKASRMLALVKKYPASLFSCLVDNKDSAQYLSMVFTKANLKINVFIDLNAGMNRTGIMPSDAKKLYLACQDYNGINIVGLHAYDGHIRETDFELRSKHCHAAFADVESLRNELEQQAGKKLLIVAGGTPTFTIHSKRANVECSPGTFVYWDKGYESILTEQPFLFAALVIARIISKPNEETICIDLGHKSIASENALDKRVYFLNAPDLQPIGHSEEHMVFQMPKNSSYKVGDVLYGIPYHICPTVALHEQTIVVEDHMIRDEWNVESRKRKINV